MKAKPGDRVVIVNKKSSFHLMAGEVVETSGRHAIFDLKVKFPEYHREVGFWWKEIVNLSVVDKVE